MSDRPNPKFSRRDFLKAAGAGLAAAAGRDVLAALGKGPATRVAHAQEGGAPPDPERYKKALDERFNVNGVQDPVALQFTEKGIQELKTQSGLDVAGDGTFRTPTPRMMADAVYFKLKDDGYGEFDPDAVADYLVEQWGPENLGPGQKEGSTFFIKVADPSTGQETYVMNVAAWKDLLSMMTPMKIPYAELEAAKAQPDLGQAPAAGSEQRPNAPAQENIAPASDATLPPVKLEATPVPLTPEQETAKKLLPWLAGGVGTGLTLLGLGWLVGRKPKETGAPSPLGQVRDNRTMTSADRAQRVARNMADKRARYK